MATHSHVLAWKIPGMGEPGRLPSMVSRRVGHDWSDLAAAAEKVKYTFITNHIWSPASCTHLQLLSAKSLQLGGPEAFSFFFYEAFPLLCLPFSLSKNASDAGLLPSRSKFSISGLCLFSSGCESCSVFAPPWNSPGQKTGVGSLSFLQGIFPTMDGTRVSCIAGKLFTNWAMREAGLQLFPQNLGKTK